HARAERLAGVLRGAGVGPETLVGLCVERSLETVVGILGILGAGGAYVPLDPDYPAERLAYLLEDSGVRVLVTREAVAGKLPEFGGRVVMVDQALDSPSEGAEATPHNLAYVIYTSGSTGRPKGVAVTHANVLRLFDATEEWFGFGPDDVWTLFHSYAFDFSVWEIWGALLHGGRLVVVPWETSRDPEAFRRLLAEERVTVLSQTPSAFRQLVRADAATGSELALREVVFGGEALEPGSLRPWTERHGLERPRLVNMHGITETTVHDSFRPVSPADVEAGSASPLGRPLPDGRLYVLDGAGELAPVGVPGELCVAGAGVARGYLGRAELTAERFVPDPFSGEAGARMYRSGDRVRRRADGELEYLGRTDFQVKVRGFRIEPGEIEAVLLEHVREAVVMVREDAPGQRRLVAYVVADGPADAAELRARAAERLPDHMVPSAFVLLDALPLTANGKTDRRALPAPDEESVARGEFVAPRDAKEAALAAVWRDVLRLDRVGVHDNFFELGGDSILSIQVISRAARAGVRLTPRQVFQHQTVAELAAVADTAATAAAEQGEVTGEAPLTPVQRWFFEQELPEPGHWNHAVLLETRRPVAPALLERAVGALLRHHDALRLRFRRENGEWRQSFAPFDGHVPFERVEGEAGEEVAERAQRSLDLEAGPLLRAVHFDAGPERPGRLLLVVHHLAVDGVSWRILVEDLERAVSQLARGEEASLPAKTTSFRAWAERLRAHTGLPETRAERDAWLAAIGGGAPPLPTDLPDGANTEGLARTVTAALTEEETRALLQEVPAAFRARIDEVLLAALARALGAWTGERSLLVELEGHGREDLGEDVDLSRTVGWFTSIFPVRLDADPDAPPAETVRAVRERLRALPGKGIGYGVLRWLAGDAELAAAPEPQVAFNYLGRFDGAEAEDALFAAVEGPAGAARSPAAPRRYLLEVNAGVAGGTFRASWTYGSRVHRAATAERLAEAYLGALRELVAAAREGRTAGPVPSDFPLLALEPAELDRVLAGLPDVEDAYPATPLQQGILFHALRSREGGMYFEQLAVHLLGGLDPEALRRAWQEVADRHAPLRTSFVPRETGEPVQVVRRRVEHPFEAHDWRGVAAGDRAALLEAFLAGDRERGFDPAVAPLSRVALLRTGDEEWHLVWSHHHVLLDGWSVPLVLGEVFALYAAARAGRALELPAPRPFREYVAWLRGRDAAASEAFWREELRGIEEPTRLPVDRGAPAPDAPAAGERELRLGEEEAASLRALARRRRVTPSTLVQGAWALLLSRYTGERDVVFGATVSGRTADLPEMETRVGVFINTLPVRVAVPSDARLGEWLEALQARQAEMRRFEHTPL
ncbi:MAG TPA: amino acid adenylation domain-containing protein, partial [Longimicrobiaceae bacterium]